MSLTYQSWDAYANDDKVLVFTSEDYGDVSADTYEFDLVDGGGDLKVRKTSASGVSVATAGGSSTYGVLHVDLTDGLELTAGLYTWQLRRTTAGREDTLAAGDLSLAASYRDLAVT